MIDSQSVKTAEAGGERGFDEGKQVDGRKRQMVVDTEGNLLTVTVHAADIQDRDDVQGALVETQELCPMGCQNPWHHDQDCHMSSRAGRFSSAAASLGRLADNCMG